MNLDCTGSAEIHLNVPGPPRHLPRSHKIVISGEGRAFHEIVAEFIPPGATHPMPTHTRADEWGLVRSKTTKAALSGETAPTLAVTPDLGHSVRKENR
jgi:hypothetical protein